MLGAPPFRYLPPNAPQLVHLPITSSFISPRVQSKACYLHQFRFWRTLTRFLIPPPNDSVDIPSRVIRPRLYDLLLKNKDRRDRQEEEHVPIPPSRPSAACEPRPLRRDTECAPKDRRRQVLAKHQWHHRARPNHRIREEEEMVETEP